MSKKGRGSLKNRPMMYITQPEFEITNVNMQKTYATKEIKKAEKKVEKDNKDVGLDESMTEGKKELLESDKKQKIDEVMEVNKKETEEITNQTKEKDIHSDEQKKRFRELSVQQKIEYLLHLPYGVPRIKCLFKTKEGSYRGIVSDYNNGKVILRVVTKPHKVTLGIEEIVSIQMLGF